MINVKGYHQNTAIENIIILGMLFAFSLGKFIN